MWPWYQFKGFKIIHLKSNSLLTFSTVIMSRIEKEGGKEASSRVVIMLAKNPLMFVSISLPPSNVQYKELNHRVLGHDEE